MTWLIAPAGVFVGMLLALTIGLVVNARQGKCAATDPVVIIAFLAVPFCAGVAIGAASLWVWG